MRFKKCLIRCSYIVSRNQHPQARAGSGAAERTIPWRGWLPSARPSGGGRFPDDGGRRRTIPGVAGDAGVLVALDEDGGARRGAGEELRGVQAVERWKLTRTPASERGRSSGRSRRWASTTARHALQTRLDVARPRGARRRRTPASTSSGSSAGRSSLAMAFLLLLLPGSNRSARVGLGTRAHGDLLISRGDATRRDATPRSAASPEFATSLCSATREAEQWKVL